MKNDELLKVINNYKEIIIFGAADIGLYLYDFIITNTNGRIVKLCDNSRKKWNEKNNIISVEQATAQYKRGIFLLTSSIYENTMKDQLLGLGILKDQIILAMTDEAIKYDTTQKKGKKARPLKKLQFEVDIVEHCNLNCKCCSQFSCIADEEFINLYRMSEDFARLGDLFAGQAERIYLIGGEPLLHPDIQQCMKIARTYFPIGKISVFTNGLLLMKCDETFWECCRNNRISIIVTKYPIALDYVSMIRKADLEKVELQFFGNSEDYKYMYNLGLDIDGKQDITNSFFNCVEANNCIKLRNGKLYTCTRPAAIYKFNKFFRMNLEVKKDDYIDIYDDINATEILDKLTHPIPFCRYCNLSGTRKAMKWGRTERKMEEWL